MAVTSEPTEIQQRGRAAPVSPAATPVQWLAPLTGVASVLLVTAGIVVLEGPADRPEESAPASLILSYFRDQDTVMLGSALFMLGALFFLWFVGELRAALAEAEGGARRISAIAFGAGMATGTFLLLQHAASFLGALYHQQLTAGMARTLFLFGDVFLYPAAMAAALLLVATAAVALRTHVLPTWLGWLSVPLALWLIVPPFGSPAGTDWAPPAWSGLGALGALPLWIVATAVVLTLRSRRH